MIESDANNPCLRQLNEGELLEQPMFERHPNEGKRRKQPVFETAQQGKAMRTTRV